MRRFKDLLPFLKQMLIIFLELAKYSNVKFSYLCSLLVKPRMEHTEIFQFHMFFVWEKSETLL